MPSSSPCFRLLPCATRRAKFLPSCDSLFTVDAQRSHAHKHVLAHSAHARTFPHHHPRYRLVCVCVLEQRALRVSAALMSLTPLPPLPTRFVLLCTCIDHRVWFVLGVVWIICTHTERDEIHHQWHYQRYHHHHHRHWRQQQQQQQQQPYKQQSRCRCRCRCRKGRCWDRSSAVQTLPRCPHFIPSLTSAPLFRPPSSALPLPPAAPPSLAAPPHPSSLLFALTATCRTRHPVRQHHHREPQLPSELLEG